MSRDKGTQEFGEHIQSLGIVPVAISYELDPCDALKANELYQRASQGAYQKGAQEDVASIGRGIAGDKGRVHVSFGTPLGAGLATADAVAAEIDRQVIPAIACTPPISTPTRCSTPTHRRSPIPSPSNRATAAGSSLSSVSPPCPEPHRPYALAIYANAVVSKLALRAGAPAPC